ncbi:MAG: HPP family protein [bacterium]|nr:HPP family protein [bacterium]MCP4800405.1 HPP family protein [bacterium]
MAIFERSLDSRFAPHWLSYVAQSIFAAASIFIVLAALRQQNLVIAASLAATTFTIFTMPSRVTASTRNVIGGHFVGLLFGSAFALISVSTPLAQDIVYALTLGCAMFVMAITNTEHPPAAGTALGVVVAGFSLKAVIGVVVGVLVLTLVHKLFSPFLRDLILASDLSVESSDEFGVEKE